MATHVTSRARSGDLCQDSGHYIFDGYTDGRWKPEPRRDEQSIELEAGETFPAIRSVSKPCWWVRSEAPPRGDDVSRMVAEGAPDSGF